MNPHKNMCKSNVTDVNVVTSINDSQKLNETFTFFSGGLVFCVLIGKQNVNHFICTTSQYHEDICYFHVGA